MSTFLLMAQLSVKRKPTSISWNHLEVSGRKPWSSKEKNFCKDHPLMLEDSHNHFLALPQKVFIFVF